MIRFLARVTVADPEGGGSWGLGPPFGPRCRLFNIGPKAAPLLRRDLISCTPPPSLGYHETCLMWLQVFLKLFLKYSTINTDFPFHVRRTLMIQFSANLTVFETCLPWATTERGQVVHNNVSCLPWNQHIEVRVWLSYKYARLCSVELTWEDKPFCLR